MATIAEGGSAEVSVSAGKVLSVVVTGEAYVDRVTNLPDAGYSSHRIVAGQRSYGPQGLEFIVVIRAISGVATYDVADPVVAAVDVAFRRGEGGAIDALIDPATGEAVPLGGDAEGLPSGGTNGQVLKIVDDTPAWAADSNTTYTAMTASEATTGTATTARTISATVLAGAITERLPTVPAAADAAPAALAAAAAVGTSTDYAREDHVHAFPAQLATSRTIALTGDVTGSSSFNGSSNASITAAIATGVIVNADVNASAAIARTKLAAHGVTAVATTDVATTDDWTVDGAAVVALVNELKATLNSLIGAA